MTVALILILVVLFGVAAIVLLRFTRARPAPATVPNWTHEAGGEFANLSDAERCDLVFAVAALDDEASRGLLARALDDPSEAVALAAARGLAHQGERETLERYLAACSHERARTLRLLVEILN